MKEAAGTHAADTEFELPDGKKVTIGEERMACAEALFNPALINDDLVD